MGICRYYYFTGGSDRRTGIPPLDPESLRQNKNERESIMTDKVIYGFFFGAEQNGNVIKKLIFCGIN